MTTIRCTNSIESKIFFVKAGTVNSIQTLQKKHLPAALALCTSAFPREAITLSIIQEKLFDSDESNYSVGYFKGSKLVGLGCASVLRLSPVAGIRLLAVCPGYQNQGIGHALLADVENHFLLNSRITTIAMMATPGNYLTPGVDPFCMNATCFLERRSYVVVNTNQNLTARSTARRPWRHRLDTLAKLGYRVCRVTPADYVSLFSCANQISSGFDLEIRRALRNQPATVHICTFKNKVVGFACAESNNVGAGVLGPLGVHPQHGGKGIAAVTLQCCAEDLDALGFERYAIYWTEPRLNRFFHAEF